MRTTTFATVFACLIVSTTAFAQTFLVQQGSPLYDAKIDIACEKHHCQGPAEITLYRKNTQTPVQTFTVPDMTIFLNEQAQPSVNVVQLYDEQSALIFNDFNFDGQPDLAIYASNDGPYGGPVYQVYVFNKTRQRFVLSRELSELTQMNLGMFQTDATRKRLHTMSKSGCCWHQSSTYSVVPGKGLRLVSEHTEDATGGGEKVTVTQREWVNGRWHKSVRQYPLKSYYPD
ncbi:FG-GAP repeat protein [Snodgrassella sp. CFCC 13594]|uniref:FG-GAP repeat protein n=1 Tax=Snodgrassella sp. CFCC 13594 TaxID=1775559 RepID=UPI000830EABA|nr:FG-GAP repeat protein [Snodgrassella sp. CFCC 13594]